MIFRLVPILFLLFSGLAQAQDRYTIRQDQNGEERRIQFQMLDATDGYTAETGLSPTCTIKKPYATSYSASTNSPSEIGSGTYQLVLAYPEYQNSGNLSVYCTGAGSRPRYINVTVLGANSMFRDGATLTPSYSNYNNSSYWAKTGVTVTEDSTSDYLSQGIGDTLTGDGASSQHRVVWSLPKPEGSGYIYITTEVKTGTLNNAWIGDYGWGAGVDFNTSTGAISVANSAHIRGWKIDKLASSWWRIHFLYSTTQSDATGLSLTIGLGNGTVGTTPPVFTTSGTMIFARTHIMRAEDVHPALLAEILPNLQTASSTTSVTLALGETTGTDVMKNREICFNLGGYTASVYSKVNTHCSCITAYNGTTKVATLSPVLSTTLNSEYKYKIGGVCLNNVNVSSMSNGAITTSVFADNTITAAKFANDAITSAVIATDAIGASEIGASAITSSEFAQSAADKVWNTAPQDGTATTALGYLDAIKKYVANKMTVVGTDYEIFKDDQTTSYATGTTNSAGRDPD